MRSFVLPPALIIAVLNCHVHETLSTDVLISPSPPPSVTGGRRLQRKRINKEQQHRIEEQEKEKELNAFRDVWEAEVLLAEREAERLLFEDIFQAFSLPPIPSPQPSPSPTIASCLNGRTREEFLLDQLSEITPTNILVNPTTPQGQAFVFMNNDPLNPDVCTYPTIDQRYGLATFFYSTDGSNWGDRQGWLSNLEECNWSGVTCNDGTLVSNLQSRKNIAALESVARQHFQLTKAFCLVRREQFGGNSAG